MNLFNSDNPENFPPSKQQHPQLDLHQAFATMQSHYSGFLQNLGHIQTQAQRAIDSAISRMNPAIRPPSSKIPPWARISVDDDKPAAQLRRAPMSVEAIEERLAGVPVYALSNANEEFVLVSGASTGKSLGLLCFKKEDAEALLEQMRSMDPAMRKAGSKVVPVALNKVFQLKVDGVGFRLIPESSQVKNALREREKAGFSDDGFFGVPVFQSRSLVLRSQNKSYRPVFFRKEDLEKSLLRASEDQHKLNPIFREGDMQVAVFEDIIKGMKESSTSTWDDVVFIPPGFDISTDPSQQQGS